MEGLCVGGGLIWKSRCGGVLRSNTGTLSLLLVCPVDSISPQLPWSSLAIRLASWSNGQVKVKVRRFAGVLAALNHHVPFGPVKGYSGRSTMPYIITWPPPSRPCYAQDQLLGAKSASSLGRPW